MAYDPNDPEDKKIVKNLIDEALKAANEEHEADIQGLKDKNAELLGKIKKGESSSDDIEKLENTISENKKTIKDLNRQIRENNDTITELKTNVESESKTVRTLLVDNGLKDALTAAKVAPQFMSAATALLAGKVELKTVAGERKAFVGDKSLGDFVAEWSRGDDGKHFVAAPASSGTGNNNNTQQPVVKIEGKTITRSQFDALPLEQKGAALKTATLVDD